MNILETFTAQTWENNYTDTEQQRAVAALEEGKILLLPQLAFSLSAAELNLATPHYVNPKTKNISYNIHAQELRGSCASEHENAILKQLLHRYCESARLLISTLLPHYKNHLITARTSLRPNEVSTRASSYRKDDSRLHVDAFPATPTQGLRILRVFTNINTNGQERVWRTGEPFPNVATQFMPKLRRPLPGETKILQLLGITRKHRTLYDHFMLQLHNAMKADTHYQQQAAQQVLRFTPGNSWIVFTDQVSHAAMSGQNVLEQSFYLPINAMANPSQSPLRVLEKIYNQPLTYT